MVSSPRFHAPSDGVLQPRRRRARRQENCWLAAVGDLALRCALWPPGPCLSPNRSQVEEPGGTSGRLIGRSGQRSPAGYFGSNLDAFNDCLSGGLRPRPEDDDFMVEWRWPRAFPGGSSSLARWGRPLAVFGRFVTRVSGVVSPGMGSRTDPRGRFFPRVMTADLNCLALLVTIEGWIGQDARRKWTMARAHARRLAKPETGGGPVAPDSRPALCRRTISTYVE